MEGILIPSIFYIRGEHMQKYLSTMLKAVLTVVGGVSFLLSCTNEVPGVPSVATIINETIITPPPETVSPSATGSVEPAVITSDLATSPIPIPTITVSAVRATNTPIPSPTVIAPEIVGLDDTLIFYTTLVDMRTSPNRPPGVSTLDDYYAFKTWPPLPFVDPVIFDRLYGEREMIEPIGMFFLNFRLRPSPDGRYMLVPGLSHNSNNDPEIAGTWLLDLEVGEARKLLPDGVIATWNPAGDAITYVSEGALYTLDIATGSEPKSLFEDEGLWELYAYWSPDGRWIAVLTSVNPELIDPENPKYAAAYWIVPANGDQARTLTVQETFAIEYTTSDISWSPDGHYLLVRNKVFDLEGNLLSPDYPGGVSWLPNNSDLLVNSREELQIMTIAGEKIAHIADIEYPVTWAWSRDGRRFAYSLGRGASGTDVEVVVYDVERGENQVIGTIPKVNSVGLLRWSADDSHLIIGLDRGNQDEIWVVAAQSGSMAELILENALLIEVVPYPVR